MKWNILSLWILVSVVAFGQPAEPTSETARPEVAAIRTLKDLDGKRIGVMSGTTMDVAAHTVIQDADVIYFHHFPDQPLALQTGKIDAFLMERPMARVLMAQRPGFRFVNVPISSYDYGIIFPPHSPKLCAQFSKEIRKMKTDGTLEELRAKWLRGKSAKAEMTPPIENPKNGTLTYATVTDFDPFSFMRSDGTAAGFDIDLITIIANRLGYALKDFTCGWSTYLEAVSSGKVDFGIACTAITPERQQRLLFSEPYYSSVLVPVVLDEDADETVSFWSTFVATIRSFEHTFIHDSRWELVLQGLKITLLITLASGFFGTLLAFPVCAIRRSKIGIINRFGRGYISLMQGTPILVTLMILYYVIFAEWDINAIYVAIIGFSMMFSSYVGEMLRTGIESIPKEQMEAAEALGFSRTKAFFKVILPQVVLQILPLYRGSFIDMMKNTSIVGEISILELTTASDIIRSRTYEAFFPLIAAALIYIIVAEIFAPCIVALEHYLNPIYRKQRRKHA